MYVLLNGSFGIGKSAVAAQLVRTVPGASIYDPEGVGFVLRRLPPPLLGRWTQPDDYQDLALWRWLIARGAIAEHRRSRVVIVPMAFTNVAYFNTLAETLGRDGTLRLLCLVAPIEVVRTRLANRAQIERRRVTEFEKRRSEECVKAHKEVAFGEAIDATKTIPEIVSAIRETLGI